MAWGDTPWADSFLLAWLTYIPIMWGLIIGPFQGLRLAAAVGYPRSQMIGRLIELAIAATAFVACALALVTLLPGHSGAMFGPLLGGGLYVATGVVEFIRRLGGR